jgi:hypothetical protein
VKIDKWILKCMWKGKQPGIAEIIRKTKWVDLCFRVARLAIEGYNNENDMVPVKDHLNKVV